MGYPFIVGPTWLRREDIYDILRVLSLPKTFLEVHSVAPGYWLIEPGEWNGIDWEIIYEYLNHKQFHSVRYSLEIPVEDDDVDTYRRLIRSLELSHVVVGYPECRDGDIWVVKGDRKEVGFLYARLRQPIRLP